MSELLTEIDRYVKAWITPETRRRIPDHGDQTEVAARFRELIRSTPACAERTSYPGHLTGSAAVVTRDLTRTLLTHHRKLGRWLQLGGHADGSRDLAGAALREAAEESGLSDVAFFPYESAFGVSAPPPLLLDLDVHWIPEGREPGHWHYDMRYLVTTDSPDRVAVSDESHDVRWFTLEEALAITAERSLRRLIEKVALVRSVLPKG